MAERITTPLVVIGWLTSLDIAPAASNTPQDTSTWAATGFLTVDTVGGSVDADTGQRNPVVGIGGWWVKPNASTPPWGKAANLLERVVEAVVDFHADGYAVEVQAPSGNFVHAKILSMWLPGSEPLRIYEPDTARAHYSIDVALSWVPVPA